LIGEVYLTTNTSSTEAIKNFSFPILKNKVLVGEVHYLVTQPTEGYLDDSASEDEDQASATPSPIPPPSKLQLKNLRLVLLKLAK
jgi:hypothetical protein